MYISSYIFLHSLISSYIHSYSRSHYHSHHRSVVRRTALCGFACRIEDDGRLCDNSDDGVDEILSMKFLLKEISGNKIYKYLSFKK